MTTRDKQIKDYAGISYANAMKKHLDVWEKDSAIYDAVLHDARAEFDTLCNKYLQEENEAKNDYMYLLRVHNGHEWKSVVYRDITQAFDDARAKRNEMSASFDFDKYEEETKSNKETGMFTYKLSLVDDEEGHLCLRSIHIERVKVL